MPKVYFASDHAGFDLKNALVEHVRALGHDVEDMGASVLNTEDDYPDFVLPCAERVAAEPGSFGIVIGGSGEGEAMAANRVKGARAAVFYGNPPRSQTDAAGRALDIVASARAHNDANILSLGARFLAQGEAEAAAKRFLETPFSGEERHRRRLAKF